MHIEEQIGLQVRNKIGKGSFGVVYQCYNPRNDHTYAVKVFYKKDFTKQKLHRFRKESDILQSIRHPNIVKFHSFQETQNCLYLLMEFIPGGTLKSLIRKRKQENQSFSEEEVSKIIKALLEGLKHLHSIGIIHRDLKPENILIAEAGDLSTLKIADFGLSAQVDSRYSNNVKAQCGTLLYMAPEIFYQPSYSKPVDIWCCAVIMYILFEGKHPIYQEGMSNQTYKQKLRDCQFPLINEPLAQNFLNKISQNCYADRYSANEALRHPWITRNSDDEIPLSVNESIHSFNTAHLVSDTLKFMYFVGMMHETKWRVPEEYIEKLNGFTSMHEEHRARSPSFKRISKRTKNAIMKIKEIYIEKDKKETIQQEYQEISSPLIKKHQKLFSRLFQKGKSFHKNSLIELEPISITQQGLKEQKLDQKNMVKAPDIFENSSIDESHSSFSDINSPLLRESLNYRKPIGKYEPVTPIKIDNKGQMKLGGIRKINSLRSDQKYEQKSSYFKHSLLKKSSFDLRDTYNRSVTKQMSRRVSIERTIETNLSRKPSTSDSKRNSTKKGKPMVFGMGGL